MDWTREVERAGGIDGLLRQIADDEAQDGLELAREGHYRLTPIQYAKARGIRPQRIYGAFRHGKLTPETCQCGRTIVDIDEADEYFGFHETAGDIFGNKYGEEGDDDGQTNDLSV